MPYSDEIMQYDYLTHNYYITPKGVFTLLGINLNTRLEDFDGDNDNTTQALRFCKKSARGVYSFIRSNCWSYSVIERIMALDTDLRQMIQQMLLSQIEYDLENDYLSLYNGIDIAKGRAMRIEDLRGDLVVTKEVADLSRQILPKYGFCLCCRKNLGTVHFSAYKKENY